MRYLNVDIKSIEQNDTLFYLTPIEKEGITWELSHAMYHPLWLQEKETGEYRIVDGFRRISTLQTKSTPHHLTASIFPADFDSVTLWIERFQKRRFEGNLSVYAVLEGLYHFATQMPCKSIPEKILAAIHPFIHTKENITTDWLNHLVAKTPLFTGFTELHQLGFKELDLLIKRDETELSLLNQLLRTTSLKGNKLTSLLEFLEDLRRGKELDLQALLQRGDVRDLISQQTGPQRYKSLKNLLQVLRYPILTQQQKKLEKCRHQLKLPPAISITSDPNFENETIQFTLSTKSVEELEELLKQLLDGSKKTAMQELFSLFQ